MSHMGTAPEGLRRLPIGTDKRFAHTLRLAKANDLSNFIECLSSVLDHGPRRVDTKALDCLGGCAARFGHENTRELTRAHAGDACQSFDGERFVQMIAGILKCLSNAVG